MIQTPYTAKFEILLRPIPSESLASVFESKSSDLFEKIYGDSARSISESWDILPVYADLAIINQFNLNGEGIDAVHAIKCHKLFRQKPLNLEHSKQDIVGHIVNTSFSRTSPAYFDSDPETFLTETDPFYLSFAGIIYSKIFPGLQNELLTNIDPNSLTYKTISASWEVGYFNYHLAIGSKNLKDCEIITDQAKIDSLSKYLIKFGGNGKLPDGRPINMLLIGDLCPYGAALTTIPAADVKGINLGTPSDTYYSGISLESEEEEGDDEEEEDSVAKTDKNVSSSSHFIKIISQNRNKDVISSKDKIMDEKMLKELMSGLQEAIASAIKDTDKSLTVFQQFEGVLKEQGQNWSSKVEAEKAKVSLAEEKVSSLESEQKTIKEQLDAANARIVELETSFANKEKAEKLASRIASVQEEYELSEAELSIVTSDLESLSTDQDYDAYLNKMSILMAKNKKSVIAEAEAAKQKAIDEAVASAKESRANQTTEKEEQEPDKKDDEESEEEKALREAKESEGSTLPNGPSSQHESLVQRLKNSVMKDKTVTIQIK